MSSVSTSSGSQESPVEDATELVLLISRLLVGVAARSLAATEDRITLVQYRALVMLDVAGERNVVSLAEALGVHPSTATRLCNRLFDNGYIDRVASKRSRREVTVSLSAAGRALVRTETARRRRAIRAIVGRLDRDQQRALAGALGTLVEAADEGPDHAWQLGWTS